MIGRMTTSTMLVLLLGVALGAATGLAVGYAAGRLRGPGPAAHREPADVGPDPMQERLAGALDQQAVVRESLERLHDQMRDLEHTRVAWQSQLHEQVADVRRSTEVLGRETRSLSTALRRPQVRGRWGELHLRRAVELAGMVEHCDFEEQVRLDDGALRPDLVVRLCGGRSVVVDAKVPLEASLDALDADAAGDEAARLEHLARHAHQLRRHVDQLASRSYWRSLDGSPEFVVLFVPAESFLSAALEVDSGLVEHAARKQVVVATPTTLIALLRTVAHGWTHEALTEQAAQIHRLGVELHGRLARFGGHLDQAGRSLNATVGHFNAAVGALDSRVLVTARRFADLSVSSDELPTPRVVDLRARESTQPAESSGPLRRAEPGAGPAGRSLGE